MKIARYKRANKHMSFYVTNFGFRKPYQVLIDGTFCYESLQNRVQIKEDLPKYLGADLKMLTTSCVIMEVEKLGKTVRGALQIVKSFALHQCGHGKKPVTGSACLLSMVKSKASRYIIATQDKELQNSLENMAGVPVLYFNRTTAVLKAPSSCSLQRAKCLKEQTVGVSEHQQSILNQLKLREFGKTNLDESEEGEIPLKKAKGPNPLSRKKKRKFYSDTATPEMAEQLTNKPKRKRKRARIPAHVKETISTKSSS